MNKSLKRQKLLKLIEEKLKTGKLITSKETELIVLNLPIKKSPGPVGFTDESYKVSSKLF